MLCVSKYFCLFISVKNTKAFFVLTSYFIICLIFVQCRNFNGLFGQDAHEYFRYSKALLNYFETTQNAGDYFWPVWYPLSAAFLSFFGGISVLFSLQLISLLSVTLIVGVVIVWPREDKNTTSKIIYAMLAVGFSPFLWRSGLSCMADAMSVALLMMALFAFSKFMNRESSKWIYAFVFCAALATMTRYASAVVLLLPSILLLLKMFSNKNWKSLLLCGIIVLLVCVPHLLIRHNTPLAFVHHEWINTWSLFNFFKTDFVTRDGIQHYKIFNLAFMFLAFAHIGFGVLVLPLLFFVRAKDFSSTLNKTLLLSVVFYSLFLAGIPFQNKRFLLATFPIVMLLLEPAVERILRFLKLKGLVLLIVATAQLFLCHKFLEEYIQRSLLEQKLASLVELRSEKILYTFNVDMAIASYDTTKVMHNLWETKYDSFEIKSLVLFNETEFAQQWKEKNPMLNWESLKNGYTLNPVSTEGSWNLYRIENRK